MWHLPHFHQLKAQGITVTDTTAQNNAASTVADTAAVAVPAPLDISVEAFREYVFSDGSTFRIENPAQLYILSDVRGVTHRVVDKDGVTHRPERGFTGIRWKQTDGKPFIF